MKNLNVLRYVLLIVVCQTITGDGEHNVQMMLLLCSVSGGQWRTIMKFPRAPKADYRVTCFLISQIITWDGLRWRGAPSRGMVSIDRR